jgi:hypothetical protein
MNRNTNTNNNAGKQKKRLKILKSYKKYLELNSFKTKMNTKNNKFISQFIGGLGLFLNKTQNVQLLCQRKEGQFEYGDKMPKTIKKNVLKTRNFKNADFFKDGMNVLFTTVNGKGTPQFLADFIGYQMGQLKKHNYFIAFLRRTLTSLMKTKYSKITGIKIVVTGRVNGAPRSKHKLISIGNMPLQKITAPIEYSTSVAYTHNGTLGVKVWVHKN